MQQDILDTNSTPSNNNNNYIPGVLPNATAVLVLGICSIAGCFLYAVPGLVCGIIALFLFKKDKAIYLSDPERYENSFKTSKAGQICGIIGLSLSALGIISIIIYFAFVFTMISNMQHY